MNKLYEIFHPEIKLMHKRLTGNDPCTDCENMHRFTRGTSWEETPINSNRCDFCMDKIFYKIDCMDKLRWYEDNDSRVNTLEQKDTNIYDCGVKCPMRLSKGYPVLYPNGWAMKINNSSEVDMDKQTLARANDLDEKIKKLEWYLKEYAIPSASCHRIKIIPKLKKLIASNFMGSAEYELDYEEFQIVNDALYEQLIRYKKEFDELKY